MHVGLLKTHEYLVRRISIQRLPKLGVDLVEFWENIFMHAVNR